MFDQMVKFLRAPDGEGQGGSTSEGQGGAGEAQAAKPDAAAQQAAAQGEAKHGKDADPNAKPAEKPKRPDWAPEKYWDKDKNELRTDQLGKGYQELSKLLGKRAADLKTPEFQAFYDARIESTRGEIEAQIRQKIHGERPAKAEDYQMTLSDADIVMLPEEFRDVSGLGDDPLVQGFKSFCYENGLSQDKFSSMLGRYLTTTASEIAQRKAGEMEILGENAGARIEAVSTWMRKNLLEEEFQAIAPAVQSATALQAFEKLIARLSGAPLQRVPDEGGGFAGEELNEARLHEMMNDKRYWHPRLRDNRFIQQVQDGFRRLYPGKTNITQR